LRLGLGCRRHGDSLSWPGVSERSLPPCHPATLPSCSGLLLALALPGYPTSQQNGVSPIVSRGKKSAAAAATANGLDHYGMQFTTCPQATAAHACMSIVVGNATHTERSMQSIESMQSTQPERGKPTSKGMQGNIETRFVRDMKVQSPEVWMEGRRVGCRRPAPAAGTVSLSSCLVGFLAGRQAGWSR
jgi:hypothetical protein